MTVHTWIKGHEVIYDKTKKSWAYKDGKGNISGNRPCRRCHKVPKLIKVRIPANLSSTGKVKWKYALIDACISPIIRALQKGGVDMRGSCCMHGIGFGIIHLQDDRVLVIVPGRWYFKKGGYRKIQKLFNKKRGREKC